MPATVRELLSAIEARLDEPTARGLAAAVGRALRDGELTGGERLPPIRTVARELALSPTTVSAAWSILARAGAIRTAGRNGTIVAEQAQPAEGRIRRVVDPRAQFALDLSTGVPDVALLPSLTTALQVLSTAGASESYLEDPVLPELQELILEDWPTPASSLAIVDGAMDAVELVVRSQLQYGDTVVVEHPEFPPALDIFEAAGVGVIGVRLDDEGVVPAELEAALAKGPRAFFLQPRAHNPTGISTTPRRAEELARVLEEAPSPVLVVEDDSAGAISTSPDVSLGAFLPERTVHIRSFGKSHGPDLRLAAVSGPDEVLAGIARLRQLGQGWSSRLLQRVLLELLSDDAAVAQVAAARTTYAERRAAFCAVLRRHDIEVTGRDGLNVWVPVRDESAALVRLASLGIGVMPGGPFQVFPGEGAFVRVTVGLLDEELDELDEVAERVAEAAQMGAWRSRVR